METRIIRDCLTSNGANTIKILLKTFLVPSKLFQQKKNHCKNKQTQDDSTGKITTLHVVITPCLNNMICLVTCLYFRAHESYLYVWGSLFAVPYLDSFHYAYFNPKLPSHTLWYHWLHKDASVLLFPEGREGKNKIFYFYVSNYQKNRHTMNQMDIFSWSRPTFFLKRFMQSNELSIILLQRGLVGDWTPSTGNSSYFKTAVL